MKLAKFTAFVDKTIYSTCWIHVGMELLAVIEFFLSNLETLKIAECEKENLRVFFCFLYTIQSFSND